VRRVAVLTLVLALTGCASGSDGDSGRRTTLTVLAASSLTDAFTALEQRYEKDHPDVDVKLSFDSSAILVEQLSQGLEADVLATADEVTMDKATDRGLVHGTSQAFATNTLVIATPQGNPARISGLDDLTTASFAVCVPAAPCGDATQRLFMLDGFTAKPVTEEENVRGVLTKVTTGEVDAGLVYASDAKAAGDAVEVVPATNASEVVNVDLIAAVKGGHTRAARDWIDLVTSSSGQRVLASFGFGPRA
jgi:molybdate transport system substrate-binding protein